MSIAGVSSDAVALSSNSTETSGSTETLGKEEFLELLVTQLKNQDPLSPVDNADFIAQMAQFSSLEQLQNLNTSMEKLAEQQEALANEESFITLAGILGKSIEARDPETGELFSGVVQGYYLDSGEFVLQLSDVEIPAPWVYLVTSPQEVQNDG